MQNRGDRLGDREHARAEWERWHDRHYHHHHHWHHGHWHGHYWRPGYWSNYWWNRYPVLGAFGVTAWAMNRVGLAFGLYTYANPYVGGPVVIDNSTYNYNQPIILPPDEQTLDADPDEDLPFAEIAEEPLDNFDAARKSFYRGDYEAALSSVNAAIREMPNDAVLHEFRALVLFALGKYQDAAATLYAVLNVGPGWDWTTMSGLYPSVMVYTQQLRALEAYCKDNPNDAAGRFVLAYHYLTAGHTDAAKVQLEALVKIEPNDQLAARLLLEIDPDAQVPQSSELELTKPPTINTRVERGDLIGRWTATRDDGSRFEMTLEENSEFTWSFTQDAQTQQVRGVWTVEEDGVLVLEMNDEGVMLAQLDYRPDRLLEFYVLGDTQGAAPLRFERQ